MNNKIRSLPCIPERLANKIVTEKQTKCFSPPISTVHYTPFEFTTFTNLKQARVRPCLSLSPKNNSEILSQVINELNEIETFEMRKNVEVTSKDLKEKVHNLKALTRLDLDELLEIRLKRHKTKRKFIKVKEICQGTKRDSKHGK